MSQASISSPTDILTTVQQLLAAGHQGIVLFNDRGEVSYASPLAVELLQITDEHQGSRVSAEISTPNGEPVSSLHALAAHLSTPALLMVKTPGERYERVVKVSGGTEGILIHDVSEEVRRDGGERGYLDVVAHDLRAGLVPVKTYAQMLHSGILGAVNEKQAEALRSIDVCVERQVEKIGSVLDTVKAEENRLELSREPVNVADVLQKVLGSYDRDVKRRSIQVVTSIQGGTVAEADVQRLQRVLSALFARSIRAAPQNGHIGAELKNVGEFLRLRVWDNGTASSAEDIGILNSTARQQSQQRLSGGAKPNTEISAIHDILREHGGRIAVQSDAGGTTYLLYLPACRKNALETRPSPRRTLVVSGDVREQEALQSALAAEGFQLFVTGDAIAAVQHAREFYAPLLFISDTLENADIWKLQASIREQRPEQAHAACMLLREIEEPQRPAGDGSTWLFRRDKASTELSRILSDMCQKTLIEAIDPVPPQPLQPQSESESESSATGASA